jgi:hypothetical protein
VPAGRLRQRLREFYSEAEAKRGKKRREVDVRACFRDLLAGILRDWHGEKTLALALDASRLGERFTVLNLSMLYRGCGIPVAWVILPAKQKGSWRPYWEELLARVAGVVPQDWKVIVTADQGLYAEWLFTAIQRLGWHPMLRVNRLMGFRAEGEANVAGIGKRVQRRGRGWKFSPRHFLRRTMKCFYENIFLKRVNQKRREKHQPLEFLRKSKHC